MTDPRIRLLVTDVDGVLTDGGLYYGPDGAALLRFNVRDGVGAKMLTSAGVNVVAISSREGLAVRKRLSELGIQFVHCPDGTSKARFVGEAQAMLGCSVAETAAIGDDMPDVDMFEYAVLSIAPADAMPGVLEHANVQLRLGGGQGAFREAADLILARDYRASS